MPILFLKMSQYLEIETHLNPPYLKQKYSFNKFVRYLSMSFSNTIPALKQSIIVMVTVNGIILYAVTKPELTTSMFVLFLWYQNSRL